MEWELLLDEDFEAWLFEQEAGVRKEVAAVAALLKERGPLLGRPQVDTVKTSRFTHMKELRIQYKGQPWRILFAFDPKRRSILLVGGNKRGEKRWYDIHIPIADARYAKHLQAMEDKHGRKI